MSTPEPSKSRWGISMPQMADLSKYTPDKTTFTKHLPDTTYARDTLSSAWQKGSDYADGWLETSKSWWSGFKGGVSAAWAPIGAVVSAVLYNQETREVHRVQRESLEQLQQDTRERQERMEDSNGSSPTLVHLKYTWSQTLAYYGTLTLWAPKVPAEKQD